MPARNVLNVREVERFLEDLAQPIETAELQDWLRGTVRGWILKHHDRFDRLVRDPATGALGLIGPGAATEDAPRPYRGTVPAWCDTALERGDHVVRLRLGAGLAKRVRRAANALEAELRAGSLPSLSRIDFPKAEALARKRRLEAHAARRKALRRRGVVPVYEGLGGLTVVRLTTPESLADEGCRMSHCVATYDFDVARGACEIYSLRDARGKSRATVEVDESGHIWQVKGFANGPVEPHYRPVLQGFIRARGYPVDDDQYNLVTRREAFPADPAKLARGLTEGGGLAALHAARFAGPEVIRDARTGLLLRTITANAESLPEPVIAAVFRALAPGENNLMRLRPLCVFWVYGARLRLVRIALPLPLLNLARQGVFRRCRFDGQARRLARAAADTLSGLVLAGPDRLHALGPARRRECWESDLLESPADVLLKSGIDLAPLRAARHTALRRQLNQARRRHRRLCPGHVAVRRLLDAAERDYVI